MEKSVTYEDRYVQAVVQYEDNRNDKLSAGGEDSEEFKQVKWVDFKQHLFSSFLISDKAFASGKFSSKNLASIPRTLPLYYPSNIPLVNSMKHYTSSMGLLTIISLKNMTSSIVLPKPFHWAGESLAGSTNGL